MVSVRTIIILLFVLSSAALAVEPDNTSAVPVLIELFTAEGCSSCPPADAWLQRLEASQPIPGIRFIVLSEHVDYWDRLGWKDAYSSAALTSRQNAYVHALGLDSAYTPQFIVNGTSVLRTSDTQKMEQTFAQAAAAPTIDVKIVSAAIDPQNPSVIHARIAIEAPASRSADVYAVIALTQAETQVHGGENKGKRLTHTSVVQQMTKIGRLEKGKAFARDFQGTLKADTDPANVRLIVFVQESGPGKVLGCTMRDQLR